MTSEEAVQCLQLADSYLREVTGPIDAGLKNDTQLGYTLLDTLKLAMKQIERAEQLDPNSEYDDQNIPLLKSKVLTFQGCVEGDAFGKYPNAVKSFKKAIEYYENNGAAHGGLGILYSNLGDKKLAVQELRRAVELYPEEIEFRKILDRVENTSDIAMLISKGRKWISQARNLWSLIVLVVVLCCGTCLCLSLIVGIIQTIIQE